MMKRIKSQSGATMVELLLALLMTGIVSAAMFRVYINQHQAWNTQDNVIEMQQNARAAIDELTRQLRMSGFSLPNGLTAFDCFNTDPDTIRIYYKTTDCDVPLEYAMANTSSELRFDGHDVSCFAAGQIAYLYDPNLESGEFFEISNVLTGSSRVQHSSAALSRAYPVGSQLMAIEVIKYFINKSDALHPRLMVQVSNGTPQVYAEDIDDLQFSYTMKNGIVQDAPTMKADVRQISISLTARTPNPDAEKSGDPYRYRTYQSKVYLRNLGS